MPTDSGDVVDAVTRIMCEPCPHFKKCQQLLEGSECCTVQINCMYDLLSVNKAKYPSQNPADKV